jgi:hypothetical protein
MDYVTFAKENQRTIIESVVQVLAHNRDLYGGAMNTDMEFLIIGKKMPGGSDDYPRVRYGRAMDIVAELIEGRRFYGAGDPEKDRDVTHPDNAKIVPIRDGATIDEGYEVKEEFLDMARQIPEKRYLNCLATPEGFREEAKTFGIDDLDGLVETLFGK